MGNKNNKPSKEQESVLVTSLDTNGLISDLQKMIDDARSTVSVSVNAGLTFLYWRIGQRLNREILKGKRAGYGKGILATVSQQLTSTYGSGFSYSALTRMIKFSEVFSEQSIVATLSQVLSWSHFRQLISLDKPFQRDFYADLRHLIDETRSSVAVAVNTGLTLLYWQVRQRIQQDILKHDRAEYAKRILQTLSAKLSRMIYGQMAELTKLDGINRNNLEVMGYGE